MHRFGLMLLMLFWFLLVCSVQAQASFKDVINFEDNRFLPKGRVEILHRYQKFVETEPKLYERSLFNYEVTYAALRNYEIGAKLPMVFFKQADQGLGDMSIFQRYKFLEQRAGTPELSGGLEFILPTGNKKLAPEGSSNLDARLHTTVSQEMALGWKWLFHLGYRWYGESDVEDRLEYNLALTHTWEGSLKSVLELNGHSGGIPDQKEVYLSPGLILRLRHGLTASISLPLGLNSHAAAHQANVQIMVEF